MKDSIFDLQRFDEETATWATIQTAGESSVVDVNTTVADGTDSDDIITTATVEGDTTARKINGNGGADSIDNVLSFATVTAGDGNDTITNTDNNAVYINAGDGKDIIYSNHSYYNTIDAGAGNDAVEITRGHYQNVILGDGDDILLGESVTGAWALGGYATVDGGAGSDLLYTGYTNNSSINAGEGSDTIITSGRNSYFDGGAGDDSIDAADSLEGSSIIGGDGNDTITAKNSSEVYIYAGAGDDVVDLYTTNSTVIGGAGNDSLNINESVTGSTVTGGTGNDTISNSGKGNLFVYNSGDGTDILTGFTASDTLIVEGTTYSTVVSGDDLHIMAGEGIIYLQGAAEVVPVILGTLQTSEGNLVINNATNDTLITGSDSADTITNTGSNVTIEALGGDDLIVNNVSGTTINGGIGNDTIQSSDESSNNVYVYNTGDGDDIVIGFKTGDSLLVDGELKEVTSSGAVEVGDGSVTIKDYIIYNENSSAVVNGTTGDDIIENVAARVTVNALSGNDTIHNSANTVKIYGDDGNDYIDGNASYVTMSGGEGDDTIEFNNSSGNFGSNASISGGDGYDSINVYAGNGITINGGVGNDTITKSITETNAVVYQYDGTGGNDVIIGLNANDTLVIDDSIRYVTVTSGADKLVSIAGSENVITLKDAANITPNFVGMYYHGNKSGDTVDNPVAQIGGTEYFYAAVSDAVNDADEGETVNVIANSTETSAINSTKDVTIKFSESGLGVYSVSGGNFTAATSVAQFTVNNGKSVTSGGNILEIRANSTATFNGYSIRGGEGSQTFTLQDGAFVTINGAAYSASKDNVTATFINTGKATVTSGAIISDTNLVASSTGVALSAGSYEVNGVSVTTTSLIDAYTTSNGVKFNLTSDTAVTFNDMTFTGATVEFNKSNEVTLTGGAAVTNVPETSSFTFSGKGTYKLNNKTVISSAPSLTVTTLEDGLQVGSNIFRVLNDDEFTLNVDAAGNISSAAGIDGGSTLLSSGGANSILTSSTGNFTFENDESTKTFAIGGDDSVTFSLTNSGVVQGIANLIGTASGSFSDAIKINENSLDLWITGDDAVTLTVDSLGAAVINGVSNGASVKSTGGAFKVTTDEEGEFVFRGDSDTQQAFTVTGDPSVDFIIREYKDANGTATMRVEGVNNFENGTYSFNNATNYHGINIGETIISTDEIQMIFSDTATFVIADSKIVSVNGIETLINNLASDVTVHATGAMTVNGANVSVTGDEDYNVLVESGVTKAVANISAGASVNVADMNVITDDNGKFKVGETTFNVSDSDGVVFATDGKGAVKNVSGLNGTIQSSANANTINGAAVYSSNTDASISAAGSNLTMINGLAIGDTVSGDIDSVTIVMPGSTETDTSTLTINGISYTLDNDNDGVAFDGYRSGSRVINGLGDGASLRVGAAGTYIVNTTSLDAKIGDIIIGTPEYSAYIYDATKAPLNVNHMEDSEIAAQAGISSAYIVQETNTMLGNLMVETGQTSLEGNVALAIDNLESNVDQTADFREHTGIKRVTLAGGEQNLMFNNEGGNVAVVAEGSEGERNITLGGGNDLAIVRETKDPVNITTSGKDTVLTAGDDVWVNMTGGATKIVPNSGSVTINGYNAATGAGIQTEFSSVPRAVAMGNIIFGDGDISLGSTNILINEETGNSTALNIYNNLGEMQKVMYAHMDGATLNTSADRADWLLIGNYSLDRRNVSQIIGGGGNDTAFGGAGDLFNLGGGQNQILINSDEAYTARSTIVLSEAPGTTEIYGFKSGFDNDSDKIVADLSKFNVSYKNGQLIFKNETSSFTFNNVAEVSDLAESADLISDNNLVNDENVIAAIAPTNYEQGEYRNAAQWSIASGQLSVVSSQWTEKNNRF